MHKVYIAGPLFNAHERWYLERIAAALEGAGYATFLPHRDAGLVDFTAPGAQSRIFRADIAALDACGLCAALLTGADQDSGTSAELGYMFARGRPCFGVTDDFRYLNNMIWGICGEGRRIARDIDGLLALLAAWEAEGAPGAQGGDGAPGPAGQAGAILQRRSAEAHGVVAPATLETVGWTLDELLEEAEDSDYATKDNSRARDLRIARDIVSLLQAGRPVEPPRGH